MKNRELDCEEADDLYAVAQRARRVVYKLQRSYSPRFERRTPKTSAHPCGIKSRCYKPAGW